MIPKPGRSPRRRSRKSGIFDAYDDDVLLSFGVPRAAAFRAGREVQELC